MMDAEQAITRAEELDIYLNVYPSFGGYVGVYATRPNPEPKVTPTYHDTAEEAIVAAFVLAEKTLA